MMALSIFYFPSFSVSRSDVERAAEQIVLVLYREATIVEQLEVYREARSHRITNNAAQVVRQPDIIIIGGSSCTIRVI
jgi:hypothetical protein